MSDVGSDNSRCKKFIRHVVLFFFVDLGVGAVMMLGSDSRHFEHEDFSLLGLICRFLFLVAGAVEMLGFDRQMLICKENLLFKDVLVLDLLVDFVVLSDFLGLLNIISATQL
jgi:hypothetical protein